MPEPAGNMVVSLIYIEAWGGYQNVNGTTICVTFCDRL
jgi:hypothetical protein